MPTIYKTFARALHAFSVLKSQWRLQFLGLHIKLNHDLRSVFFFCIPNVSGFCLKKLLGILVKKGHGSPRFTSEVFSPSPVYSFLRSQYFFFKQKHAEKVFNHQYGHRFLTAKTVS